MPAQLVSGLCPNLQFDGRHIDKQFNASVIRQVLSRFDAFLIVLNATRLVHIAQIPTPYILCGETEAVTSQIWYRTNDNVTCTTQWNASAIYYYDSANFTTCTIAFRTQPDAETIDEAVPAKLPRTGPGSLWM